MVLKGKIGCPPRGKEDNREEGGRPSGKTVVGGTILRCEAAKFPTRVVGKRPSGVRSNFGTIALSPITGNLLGLIHGVSGIPADWVENLDARRIVEQVADDLHARFIEDRRMDPERYPPTEENPKPGSDFLCQGSVRKGIAMKKSLVILIISVLWVSPEALPKETGSNG